jgi:hypothetical protein
MKKWLVILAVFLAATGFVYAQTDEAPAAGTFTWSGWARAGFGMDFENEKPLPDNTTDPSGAGVKLTYKKGDLEVSGDMSASLNNEKWEFDEVGFTFYTGYWNQDANDWGLKGAFSSTGSAPLASTMKYGALFLQFMDKKLLFDGGFGDYTDAVWGTPGPYEFNSNLDHPLVRLQFKLVPKLNFGFAFGQLDAPNTDKGSPFAGDEAFDTSKLSLGVKYDAAPLVVAAGFNAVETDEEEIYFGGSYKISDALTAKLDGKMLNVGDFGDSGVVNLGENISYSQGALSAGLTIKEEKLVDNTDSKTMQLILNPSVKYAVIEKVFLIKLSATYTKGLGDGNDKLSKFDITPALYFSLKGDVTDGLGDFTGFAVTYAVGVGKDAADADYKNNQLKLGFRASF